MPLTSISISKSRLPCLLSRAARDTVDATRLCNRKRQQIRIYKLNNASGKSLLDHQKCTPFVLPQRAFREVHAAAPKGKKIQGTGEREVAT